MQNAADMTRGGMGKRRRWHVWVAAAGLVLGVADQMALDSMPSKAAVSNPGWQYALGEAAGAAGFSLLALALFTWLASLWRNDERGPLYVALLVASTIAFVIADWGSFVLAQVLIAGASVDRSISALGSYAIQPVLALLLIAPFLALAWVTAPVAKRNPLAGIALFSVALVVMMALYYFGHIEAETFAQSRKWTAATLSLGMLPVKGAVLIVICMFVSQRMLKRRQDT